MERQHTTWMDYGGSPDQSKYVVQDEIDKSNVDQLEVAWTYHTEDNSSYMFNPVVVDTVMYLLAKNNSLVAVDARTGEEIWIHANLRGIAQRGVNYWESPDRSDKRLLFQMNDYLQAIDATTGESILSFGENGLVDLKKNLPPRDPATVPGVQSSTPGKIFENLIILGSSTGEIYMSPPGHIRAYDVVTGELVWRFNTIPQPGEYGYETWPEDAYKYVGGANVWSEISVDEERGIGYFPTGSPTYDFYGADRHGKNLFGNSLLALDLRTGERLWHFQVVHHDILDYDLASAPQLVTVNHSGKTVDAVAIATKQGFLFVFDRVTGEPLWPIEERPVPQSDVPGEESWPTQPFPTVLPPFARQSMTSSDINPYHMSEEDSAEWTERIDELERLGRTDLYTPFSVEHETLVLPGVFGGSNFGSTAANPEKGMVYVVSVDWPTLYDPLEIREREEPESRVGVESEIPAIHGEDLYMNNCAACHGANWGGSGNVPSLAGVETRLNMDDFRYVVVSGRGEMPGFSNLNEEQVSAIYQYLGGSDDGSVVELPSGPVIGSGGAPGSLAIRQASGGGNGQLGAPYPEDVDVPDVRYYSPGFGLQYQWIISPPWGSIVAYDLNEGKIKWRRPLGNDQQAVEEGAEEPTGTLGSIRRGMIVTSSGLLFATSRDGHFFAFDADTGEELWSAELPMVSEGLPAMYQVDGRHYIIVPATTPFKWGRDFQAKERPKTEGGYVVFSLPE